MNIKSPLTRARQCQEHRSQGGTLLGEPAQAAEKQKFVLLQMVLP